MAIAEQDLRVDRTLGALNAVANAITDVNRFRCQLGLVLESLLPPHNPDPSLCQLQRVQSNGVQLFHFGFGVEVGQRVSW